MLPCSNPISRVLVGERSAMSAEQRYLDLLHEIAQLAQQCGRPKDEITLITVSKGHSWQEMFPFYNAGSRDFGESKYQEAAEKIAEAPTDIRWHLIGTLQRKKVAKVIGMFSLIHSVDTPELALKLAATAKEQSMQQSILLQVNTSGEESKHGLSPEAWREEVETLLMQPHLRVEGLMTMAPFTDDEKVIRRCFQRLREFRDELGLKHLSMGMSHDYRIAIEEGATLLRIGSALFE